MYYHICFIGTDNVLKRVGGRGSRLIWALIRIALSDRVHIRQGNVREMFFQGQGIVREFCDVSGENEMLQKCQGNVREFYISA